jgi:hypothetical protein
LRPGEVRIETRGVLAGAYRGKDIGERALLTHAVAVDAQGSEVRVLCGRVKLDHVVDCYADDINKPPTCPNCLERMPKK